MVGDDREPSAGLERVAKPRQRSSQIIELVVDGDAQSLEQPGEISRPGLGTKSAADRIDQVVAGREALSLPAAVDLSREPARSALIPKVTEYGFEGRRPRRIQKLGGSRACRSQSPAGGPAPPGGK